MAANRFPLTRLEIFNRLHDMRISPFSPRFNDAARDLILLHHNLTVADLTPASNADLRKKISIFRKDLRKKLRDNNSDRKFVIDKYRASYFDINFQWNLVRDIQVAAGTIPTRRWTTGLSSQRGRPVSNMDATVNEGGSNDQEEAVTKDQAAPAGETQAPHQDHEAVPKEPQGVSSNPKEDLLYKSSTRRHRRKRLFYIHAENEIS